MTEEERAQLLAEVTRILESGRSRDELAAEIVRVVSDQHHCRSCDGHSCPDVG